VKAHETYLPGLVKAIECGLGCIPGPCEICGGKTVSWTESKIDPTYYFHSIYGGGQHRIDVDHLRKISPKIKRMPSRDE
jgi:hypothetical protein